MKITWGTKLVALTVLFMCFIVFMVIKMVNQDVALIENDYYEKGENYQATIDENKGADSLILFEIINVNSQTVLRIENRAHRTISNAQLSLKYLANKTKDKTFEVQIGDSIPTNIDISNFEKGNWVGNLNWTDNSGKHYLEKNFDLK
ncbi:MAG: FixH family protein [Candidatus Methylacidiphilales bacterium]